MNIHVICSIVFVAIIATTVFAGSPIVRKNLYPSNLLREGRRNENPRFYPSNVFQNTVGRRSRSSSCMIDLMQQHPEICDIVQQIRSIQDTIPQLRKTAKHRMGTRRFDFKYVASKGKTAMEQLYEVVNRLGDGIKKFIKFFGAAEETFDPDFNDIKESTGSDERVVVVDGTNTPVIPELVSANPQSRRASTTCQSDIQSIGSDFCAILMKINELDEVLNDPNDPTIDNDDLISHQLPITIHSTDLVLAGFFDALYRSIMNDSGMTKIVVTPGRRYLVNENHEDIAEIFETPDFRIEFIDQDSDGSTRKAWQSSKSMLMYPTYPLDVETRFADPNPDPKRINWGRLVGKLFGNVNPQKVVETGSDIVTAAHDVHAALQQSGQQPAPYSVYRNLYGGLPSDTPYYGLPTSLLRGRGRPRPAPRPRPPPQQSRPPRNPVFTPEMVGTIGDLVISGAGVALDHFVTPAPEGSGQTQDEMVDPRALYYY